MECIFLEEGKSCTANLPQYAPSGWEVDDDTMKKYCVKEVFNTCPRYKAYMEYIKYQEKSSEGKQ